LHLIAQFFVFFWAGMLNGFANAQVEKSRQESNPVAG
jgi:hypothetical protein